MILTAFGGLSSPSNSFSQVREDFFSSATPLPLLGGPKTGVQLGVAALGRSQGGGLEEEEEEEDVAMLTLVEALALFLPQSPVLHFSCGF